VPYILVAKYEGQESTLYKKLVAAGCNEASRPDRRLKGVDRLRVFLRSPGSLFNKAKRQASANELIIEKQVRKKIIAEQHVQPDKKGTIGKLIAKFKAMGDINAKTKKKLKTMSEEDKKALLKKETPLDVHRKQ
jgi:hypothetical protein